MMGNLRRGRLHLIYSRTRGRVLGVLLPAVALLSAQGCTLSFKNPVDALGPVLSALIPVTAELNVTTTSFAAGSPVGSAVYVRLLDSNSQLVTATNYSVTIALVSNPPGGTLSGTLTQVSSGGIATFNNLSLDKAGTGYTLQATVSLLSLTSAVSPAITIVPGAPAVLTYSVQPINTLPNTSISPAIAVQVFDGYGNQNTTNSVNVTLSIQSNPGSSTLGGTTTVASSSGVATFSNITLNNVGTGYTLTAASSGLTSATSSTFNIQVAGATKLAYSVQPSNVAAMVGMTPSIQVQILDAGNSLVATATDTVTLSILTNPGSSTLGGTISRAAVAGVATFPGITLNKVGTGYVLRAAASGLSSADSNTFNVTVGAAAALVFTVQPVDTPPDTNMTPPVRVRAVDAGGNSITTAGRPITIAIWDDPSGWATLSGTTTRNTAIGGLATFSGLQIDSSGNGYTFQASSAGLTDAISNPFNVTNPGGGTKLAFSVQPSDAGAGSSISPSIVVHVLDNSDTLMTGATDGVTLTIQNNVGGATLSGSTFASAVAGVATFSGISLDKIGTGYTLKADASGLLPDTSTAFNIAAGAKTRLAIGTQPSNTSIGAAISPAVTVQILDTYGNLVTTATDTVTLALQTDPVGAVVSGTTSVAAVGGIATFNNIALDAGGVGFKLRATSGSLTSIDTNPFNVVSATPTKLVYRYFPSTVRVTGCSAQFTLELQDASGNLAANTGGTMSIPLSETAAGAVSFFTDPTCTTSLSGPTATIATGASQTTFYIKSTSVEEFNLTADAPGAITDPTTTIVSTNSLTGPAYCTDGTVNSIVNRPGTTYLGGNFSRIGTCTGRGIALNVTTGAISSNVNMSALAQLQTGTVQAVVADGSGGWYVASSTGFFFGSTYYGIVHIYSNGSRDTTFSVNTGIAASSLILSGGVLYVGGSFSTINGVTRNGVAALNPTTGAVLSFNPNVLGGVNAMALSGTTLYVGGGLYSVGGNSRNFIAAIDTTTGLATAWNPGTNGNVNALLVSGTTLYMGGQFTTTNSVTRNYLAAYDTGTGALTAFNPSMNDRVNALGSNGTNLYVGGWFTLSGATSRVRGAAYDLGTGALTGWNPVIANYGPAAFAFSGSNVYIGGQYSSINGAYRGYVAAVDSSTGANLAWDPGADLMVTALAVQGTDIFVGGYFSMIAGTPRSFLGAVDSATGSVTSWNPGANATVRAITGVGNTIYVGGDFNLLSGSSRNRLGAVDATTGAATAFNPNLDGSVSSFHVQNGILYVAGYFGLVGATTRHLVSSFDLATGTLQAFNPNATVHASPAVKAITGDGTYIYIGGQFGNVGGSSRANLAQVDGTTGAVTSWNPGVDNSVNTLLHNAGLLYVGGYFTTAGGKSRPHLAAINTTSARVTSFAPPVQDTVGALGLHGNRFVIGGAIVVQYPYTGPTFLDLPNTTSYAAAIPSSYSNFYTQCIGFVGDDMIAGLENYGSTGTVASSTPSNHWYGRQGVATWDVNTGLLLQ